MISFDEMNGQFSSFSVGVDRGGSLTRVLALGKNGERVHAEVFDTASEIQDFIDRLVLILRDWQAEDAPLVIATRGALSRPEIRLAIQQGLAGKANLKAVISDAQAAHLSAFSGGYGVLLISGTGSVVLSGSYGHYKMTGGTNPVTGDLGSGRWLGRKWLVYKGQIKENEEQEHGKSAAYAKLMFEMAERHKTLSLQEKKQDEDGAFCHKTVMDGAMALAELLRKANPKKSDKLTVAITGGTMKSDFYKKCLLEQCKVIMPNTHVELFALPIPAEQAAAKLAATL